MCVESGGGSELDEAPHTHFIWKQIVLECFKLTTAFFFSFYLSSSSSVFLQDQTVGQQLRDASLTKASLHTRKTSSRCRNRYVSFQTQGEGSPDYSDGRTRPSSSCRSLSTMITVDMIFFFL